MDEELSASIAVLNQIGRRLEEPVAGEHAVAQRDRRTFSVAARSVLRRAGNETTAPGVGRSRFAPAGEEATSASMEKLCPCMFS
jgi:hypothetical protein